jgi:hypothetical protein
MKCILAATLLATSKIEVLNARNGMFLLSSRVFAGIYSTMIWRLRKGRFSDSYVLVLY